MAELSSLRDIAEQVAFKHLGPDRPQRVMMQRATDSDGDEALRVTLVIRPESVKRITGDQTLDVITDIQQAFDRVGDLRFPIIEYATEQELAAAEQDMPVAEEDDEDEP